MLIRITNGTFGYRPPDKDGNPGVSVIPKTVQDPPFEVADKLAARLIEIGVAAGVSASEFVEAVATPLAAAADTSGDAPSGNTAEDETPAEGDSGLIEGRLDYDQLMTLSFNQLKQLAADMAIDTNGLRSKAALASAIVAEPVYADPEPEAVMEDPEDEEEPEPDEEPPALEALGPVG